MVDISFFLAALYEFGVNVIFIALAAEAVLLALRAPLHRDLNDDGVIDPEEAWVSDILSRKVRRYVVLGTIIFAIPCVIFTAGSIGSTGEGVEDGYGVMETTRELKAILPGFESYSVGVDVSSDDMANPQVTRETVAHVVTDGSLDERSRETTERLIRLNVPQLDRVEFTTQAE